MLVVQRIILAVVDSAIYAFIGPFAALYVFPQFIMYFEKGFYTTASAPAMVNAIGVVLMWAGAIVAIWCGLLMAMNKWGSVVPFYKPTALVSDGPYSLVRHPMMWALFLVLAGEVFVYLSPALIIWLMVWARFSHIYISKHEEPFLHQHFGKAYVEYSERVPRWIPFTRTTQSK